MRPSRLASIGVARVYITRSLPEHLVESVLATHDVGSWEGEGPVPRDVLMGQVVAVDGLLTMITEQVDAALLDRAPSLTVVSQMAVGVDNIDVDQCTARGIAVGHTPGVLTETVADTAFALLSSIVRRLPEGQQAVKDGLWGPWDPFWMTGSDLAGSTIGIVGMGRIGRAVARRAAGFGMRILFNTSSPRREELGEFCSLEELLESSDHVVVCVSLTDQTVGLIGTRELELMKDTAFLVNVSRGPVVDTDAVVDALGRELVAGVALDVTEPEPLPPNHPLLGFSNCLVVPHIGSASKRTREAMAELAISNLLAGIEGRPLPARVVVS